MVIGHVFAVNPANPVRGPKDIACAVAGPHRGAGPTTAGTHRHFDTAVGVWVEDHYPRGACAVGAAAEKGGKRQEMLAHHDAKAFIDEYLPRQDP
jgi:hypothetical protein